MVRELPASSEQLGVCAACRGPGWLRLGEGGRAKQEGFHVQSGDAICPWWVGLLPVLEVAAGGTVTRSGSLLYVQLYLNVENSRLKKKGFGASFLKIRRSGDTTPPWENWTGKWQHLPSP